MSTNATLAKIDGAGAKLQNIGSSLKNVGKKKDPTNMDGNTKIYLENQDTAEARVQKYIPAFSMPIFERRRRSRLILSTLKDGWDSLHRMSAAPVSYTHLDVYKRQVCNSVA